MWRPYKTYKHNLLNMLGCLLSATLFSEQCAGENSLINEIILWAAAATKRQSLYQISPVLTMLFRATVMGPGRRINAPSWQPEGPCFLDMRRPNKYRVSGQTRINESEQAELQPMIDMHETALQLIRSIFLQTVALPLLQLRLDSCAIKHMLVLADTGTKCVNQLLKWSF